MESFTLKDFSNINMEGMEFCFSFTFLIWAGLFIGPFDIITIIALANLALLSLCYCITRDPLEEFDYVPIREEALGYGAGAGAGIDY